MFVLLCKFDVSTILSNKGFFWPSPPIIKWTFGKSLHTSGITSINKSKENSLEQFISGLGIRHVGARAAKVLSDHFLTIDKILAASVADLVLIDDIGEITAQSIYDFFQIEANVLMISNLKESSFNFYAVALIERLK